MNIKNVNRKYLIVIAFVIIIGITNGCKKDFLDYTPKGAISDGALITPDKVDQLCTAAYANLGNNDLSNYAFMWVLGGVRAGDSYKGGGSVADVAFVHNWEVFNLITVDMTNVDGLWTTMYNGVARADKALIKLDDFTVDEFPEVNIRKGEMQFLRGHFEFLLKILFKYPVYFNYNTSVDSLKYISNRLYSNNELWDKIAEDFQFAVDNLPESQSQVGRANKYAAEAYLAKVRLYQAYEQDENNNVTSINLQRLNEVVTLCNDVINSGKYGLANDYAENFLFGYENGTESIFAIQYSINDGTVNGRIQMGTALNYSMAPGYGCCGFHIPSQNFINAFKTGTDGLPLFDTYDNVEMKDSIDFWTNNVDPRIDHSVGIPTHPFKYDPTFIYQKSWARTPAVYGYFGSMKELQLPTSPSYKKIGPFPGTSENVDILRYDDILLMKAEALIELGQQNAALPIINQVRTRAANSTGRLKYSDGTFVSNYLSGTYVDGVNCVWTQDFARKALQWERRLEFGVEDSRFFDLVRWGTAAETINAFFEKEKARYSFLSSAHFTKGRDEYFPIPQAQIDLVEGLYEQNNGW
jgi:starch-binding outer membrane protein, SusD/RagB family